jgi:hypothetical protein
MATRKGLLILGLVLLLPAPVRAWNGTGHMVVGMLSYRQLPREKRARFVEMLKAHPAYARWLATKPERLPDGDLGLYLFMRASAWPDELRNEKPPSPYHHPGWHYTEFQLRPTSPLVGAPVDMKEDILYAIRHNQAQFTRPTASPAERAIALSWLIHLVGDVHQPLHCVSMFSDQNPKRGNEGGNLAQHASDVGAQRCARRSPRPTFRSRVRQRAPGRHAGASWAERQACLVWW